MGAVDLVIQVESPKSVARGLQRIGRAGHSVGDVSRGRIFPKFRADLLECAVVAKRMRAGEIETTVVPRNALDVLAQQIVAIAAAAPDDKPVAVDDLYALVTRTHSYAELSRTQLENVLDMLDGRYPSSEFAELRPRIVWDRIAGTFRARPGARQLAVTNAGTIPDRGLYAVTLPDGRRVGELDEEMVYEARPGQTFLLGASTWRIEEIGRDRVIVTPAPGLPGAVPFWKGDGIGRPKELGEAIGAFSRWAVGQEPEALAADYDLDRRAANNLVEFLREQEAATRVIPSDRAIVVERFRDEIGDWRLCILSPFGGRVHAAWGLALTARIREEIGLESDAIWSDDGIIVHLPDAEEPPGADLVMLEPDEIEDRVVAELSASALFGARFRENAARALLIPRARPGKRTPLWQQRLKAQSLLEVAKKYGEFPIVLETYRECLRDVLDVPGLVDLLTALHRREISLIEVETPTASPFASSLLFDYVATYMYEGDTPNAERRAAALSLDRDLLRELLGQDELRDLIDPGALAQVEDDLQFLSDIRRAGTRDALHDILRTLGDLTAAEAAMRVLDGVDADSMLSDLRAERRALTVRVGGEERWIDAADAGLYRDALGVAPPGGLPAAFLEDVPDALVRLVRRYGATHGPFTVGELRARYGVDPTAALNELEREGVFVRGELRPGGTEREWCDPEVLRRLRRASLAVLRKEVEPVDHRALARFLPAWQNVDRHPASGAGVDRLREALVPLQGLALPADAWERDVLPRRVGAYSPTWMDQLCAAARSYGSGRARWAAAPDGWPCTSARTWPSSVRPSFGARRPATPTSRSTTPSANGSPRERASSPTCWSTSSSRPRSCRRLCGTSCGRARRPTTRSRRCGRRGSRSHELSAIGRVHLVAARGGSRLAGAAGAAAQVQGRWSLTAPLFAAAVDPGARRRALAELLLERYGVLTREQVLAEGIAGGFSAIYCRAVRNSRRWGRSPRLLRRGARRRAVCAARRGRAAARAGACARGRRSCWRRSTPRSPTARRCPGPTAATVTASRRPARAAGAHVVLSGGDPILYLERVGAGAADAGAGGRRAACAGARGARGPGTCRRDQAPGAREGRRRAGDGVGAGAGAGRARLPGRSAAADADRLGAAGCLRGTRSPGRRTGSARYSRESCRTRSRHRSRGTRSIAGRSASRAAP